MSTQTLLGHSFPTPCKRCGGALYRQVDYCPYCGAIHPLEGDPHKRVEIPSSRASAMNKSTPKSSFESTPLADTGHDTGQDAGLGEADRVEAEMQAPILTSPDAPIPPLANPPHWSGGRAASVRMMLMGSASIVVIGLTYVGYALFSDNHEWQTSNTDESADTHRDARTATGIIALYKPALSPKQPNQPNQPNQVSQAKPIKPANPATAAPPVAPASASAPAVAVTPPSTPQFRNAAQAVQAARAAFHANDLSAAQAALSAAQTLQPDNADAQNLLGELKPLTARRETALQAAQACAAQQLWTCVRQHANDALTIDIGNATAKTLLERAIRETGWAPLNSHAAASGPAQARQQTQPQTKPSQTQLQVPLPKDMPANSSTLATAPAR
ncbi:hypothetical protein [Paraburkholderia lacunae]|uniref:hypothetical protein n=1 Tax=Paraburkholderia lacunae TaxID=2211104 RepID=UPI001AD83677|nr:hypothetical protein [Paraburkholderia lacunae]